MSQKPNIQIPLDLPDIDILETEITSNGDYVITVQSILTDTECHKCGQTINRVWLLCI